MDFSSTSPPPCNNFTENAKNFNLATGNESSFDQKATTLNSYSKNRYLDNNMVHHQGILKENFAQDHVSTFHSISTKAKEDSFLTLNVDENSNKFDNPILSSPMNEMTNTLVIENNKSHTDQKEMPHADDKEITGTDQKGMSNADDMETTHTNQKEMSNTNQNEMPNTNQNEMPNTDQEVIIHTDKMEKKFDICASNDAICKFSSFECNSCGSSRLESNEFVSMKTKIQYLEKANETILVQLNSVEGMKLQLQQMNEMYTQQNQYLHSFLESLSTQVVELTRKIEVQNNEIRLLTTSNQKMDCEMKEIHVSSNECFVPVRSETTLVVDAENSVENHPLEDEMKQNLRRSGRNKRRRTLGLKDARSIVEECIENERLLDEENLENEKEQQPIEENQQQVVIKTAAGNNIENNNELRGKETRDFFENYQHLLIPRQHIYHVTQSKLLDISITNSYLWKNKEAVQDLIDYVEETSTTIGPAFAKALKFVDFHDQDQTCEDVLELRWLTCLRGIVQAEDIIIQESVVGKRSRNQDTTRRCVNFCTFDLSGIDTPQENCYDSINTSQQLVFLLEEILCECEKLRMEAYTNTLIIDMIHDTIARLQQTSENSSKCVNFVCHQLSRITQCDQPLPYQERFGELLSVLIRFNLRRGFNPPSSESSSNLLLYEWKKNSGTFLHNDSNIAAVINHALFKLDTSQWDLEDPNANDLDIAEVCRQIITAKLFLHSLLCWPGIMEDIEKREQGCLGTIEYSASLIKRYNCVDEEQYIPLSNIREYAQELANEEEDLRKAKQDIHTLIRQLFGKKRVAYQKYEKSRPLYPTLVPKQSTRKIALKRIK